MQSLAFVIRVHNEAISMTTTITHLYHRSTMSWWCHMYLQHHHCHHYSTSGLMNHTLSRDLRVEMLISKMSQPLA